MNPKIIFELCFESSTNDSSLSNKTNSALNYIKGSSIATCCMLFSISCFNKMLFLNSTGLIDSWNKASQICFEMISKETFYLLGKLNSIWKSYYVSILILMIRHPLNRKMLYISYYFDAILVIHKFLINILK